MTEQLALEDQLRQSQKMDALGQLAGGIAHDFNNLITAIRANVELAEKFAHDQNKLLARLGEIEKAAARASTLTRHLLSFSRRQPLSPEAINLSTHVRDIMKLIRRLIPENIEVLFTTTDDVPLVRADSGQMEQIIMNLCVNARDAMPNGGRLVLSTDVVQSNESHVAGHADATDGCYVRLVVEDSGDGMTPEVHKRAFEPFFTTKGLGKGTGLGLSTVYGIVLQHHGFIRLESEPNRGTRVEILLPESEVSEDIDQPPESLHPMGGSETILLAEDEKLVRDSVVEILEGAGYTVLVAKDGSQAVRTFESHRDEISLALLDVVMPEMAGPDAYREMVKLRPNLPVLFTSGYSNEAISITSFSDGNEMLAKPYQPRELLARVRTALDRKVLTL
jgi:nitrogen-specific signal transduction histidine kinase/ActR/RegA family two-component response regulator